MNKRAIAILGAIFLLIVGTLGFLIYSKNKSKTTTTNPPAASSANPPSGSGNQAAATPPPAASAPGAVKLSSDQVVSPALFYNGAGITYFDQSGQLFQVNIDASSSPLGLVNKRKLGIQAKAGISKILWPDKGDNFIAEFDGINGQSWSSYDSQVGAYTDLPKQIGSLNWMPGGQKIIYTWLSNSKLTLNTSDANGKNFSKISELFAPEAGISVSPDGLNIVFFRQASSDAINKLTLTTPDGKVWRDLVTDGYNLGALWSPDSQRFLFQKKDHNTQAYQLWYYDILTGEVKNLGLFSTLAKAVWDKDSKTIYAAVPTIGTAGGGSLTTDSFYKLDTQSLDKKQYQAGTAAVDGEDLFLNLSSDKLFFKNGQDGGLYYLDLTQQ